MSGFPSGSEAPMSTGGNVLIKIKTLEPATYEVHIDRQITVAELKTKLEGIIRNAPAGRQRIIFRGRGLEDERTLQDVGVENGDTIHLVIRPTDAPAAVGAEQVPSQAPSLQDQINAETRRVLEQINQAMNLHVNHQPGGSPAGLVGRRQEQQQQAQQPGQQQEPVPHLFITLHRFLQRLREQDYAPSPAPLMSSALDMSNPQEDFETLSRAITEVLGDTDLPEQMVAMREEARRDPAGRGRQEQQQAAQGQGQAASAQDETVLTGEVAGAASAPAAAGAPEGEERSASVPGPADGTQRAERRTGPTFPDGLDYMGANYGYRYMPLVAATVAVLLDRTEAHLSGGLAQQLRQGAAAARELATSQAAGGEAAVAAHRALRRLGADLHAAAALLIDMSRGVLATLSALETYPRTLAVTTAATLRADGTDADLPLMLPRIFARPPLRGGREAPADLGFLGPMGGLVDVFGAQFAMPMGGPGAEDDGGGAAAAAGAAAPGARVQPPGGVAMGTLHIDLGDVPNMPGGLGGLINNIISAVRGAAVAPPGGAGGGPVPGTGAAGGPQSATPDEAPGDGNAGSGAEARQPRGTVLGVLMPALTAVAGSIAASVMRSLEGRRVLPHTLLNALSQALTEHLSHVLEVLTSRWDGLNRAAARQRRATRAQEEQQQPTGDQASAPTTTAPSSSATGTPEPAVATGTSSAVEEFRPVAQLINQLFSSWESVLQVPAEPIDGEGEDSEGSEADEERPGGGQEDDKAEGEGQRSSRQRQQSRPSGDAGDQEARRGAATRNDELSNMMRMLMPSMASSIGRSVAHGVFTAVLPQAGSLNGQQLAIAVLETLVARLEVVADMVLANWSRISSGLEEIESASDGASASDMMSQMFSLAASIMSGVGRQGSAPRPPAVQPRTAQRTAPQHQHPASQTQGVALGPEAAATSTPAHVPSTTPQAIPEASATLGAPTPAIVASVFSEVAPPHSGEVAGAAPEVPTDAPQQSSTPGLAATATAAVETVASASGGEGASGTGTGTAVATVQPAGVSSAPKGLGLGLRQPASKKKAAAVVTAPEAGAVPSGFAAAAPTQPDVSGSANPPLDVLRFLQSSRTRARESGDSDSIGISAEAAPSASTAAELLAPPMQAPGSKSHSAPRGTGGDEGSGGAGDTLDGLLEMVEQVLGTLDPQEPGGSGGGSSGGGRSRAGIIGPAGGGGMGGGGGGLGGLLQMAQNIVSDPAMQPMIGNMMNMVLGGGGGGGGAPGGAAGGGLGNLLGSLLGGLPPPSSGSGRSASLAAAARVGYEVLTEVLGLEEGSRWRELIERDVEEMQQHVQVAPEEHSANYRRGVPSRRTGLVER